MNSLKLLSEIVFKSFLVTITAFTGLVFGLLIAFLHKCFLSAFHSTSLYFIWAFMVVPVFALMTITYLQFFVGFLLFFMICSALNTSYDLVFRGGSKGVESFTKGFHKIKTTIKSM
jgi:uncharacterized protein YacL